jgi:hypothetical protein
MRAGRRPARLAVLAAALGLTGGALQPATAMAQQADTPRATSTIQVVAEGLNAPRGLVYDRDRHRVLVAEAGVLAGNTGPCGFAERGLPFCLGPTGSIFEYSESGQPSRRIVTGLPSTGLQEGPPVVIGLHDLSLRGDRITAVFGLLGNLPYRESLGPGAALLAQAVTIDAAGRVRPFADIIAFEDRLYPGEPEANPYGLATGRFGTVVANAGGPEFAGNDLLLIKRDGTIVQLAQFPARHPAANPADTIESVPTSVALGPDGAFYVGELTGAPFYPGEARVWRVVPGRSPTVYAQGFTLIIDIAFDEHGRLIVLETAQTDPFDTTQDGSLIRVERDGRRTVLASAGMKNPGGVAVAGRGVYYVTTETASGGGVGQLLRIRVPG